MSKKLGFVGGIRVLGCLLVSLWICAELRGQHGSDPAPGQQQGVVMPGIPLATSCAAVVPVPSAPDQMHRAYELLFAALLLVFLFLSGLEIIVQKAHPVVERWNELSRTARNASPPEATPPLRQELDSLTASVRSLSESIQKLRDDDAARAKADQGLIANLSAEVATVAAKVRELNLDPRPPVVMHRNGND